MISKVENSIHVEAFELSPLNQPVITTKGRLRRSFPGPAFSVNVETFKQPELLATVAHTLTKMSHQRAVETMPKATKAGRKHDEDRDTSHPIIITELFMAFLRPFAEPVVVSYLWKNTREEVMWLDSLLPWRRSPTWLLIRVAMQLIFSRSSERSRDLYKTFMLFCMSNILELSHQYHLPSELYHAMNAKLSRRLLKIDSAVDSSILNFVQNVMRKTYTLMSVRWSSFMKKANPHYDLSQLEHLNFRQDEFNSLPALEEYIKSLAKREHQQEAPAFQPSSALIRYQSEELPTCFSSLSTEYTAYDLRAFEDWVAANLRQWLERHKGDLSTCGRISGLIYSYHGIACPFYSGNPEATSIMLLTILELWIACDESAVHICALLGDYDVGIPLELFQSLILPFRCQMERLIRVEDYLNRRQARTSYRSPGIFHDYGLQNCFPVKYFNQSPEHQELLRTIENRANIARQRKRDEFHSKKEEYNCLMRRYDHGECEYSEVIMDEFNDFRELRHSIHCQKCDDKSQAESLVIRIHEWPLPSNEFEAQSTVFELSVPPYFGQWRDAAWFLLLDVLNVENLSTNPPRAHHHLHNYQGLSSSFIPFSAMQRLGLMSEDKPHEVTHRRNKSIATATEDDVCLNNGLWYRYYDGRTDAFVNDFHVDHEISKLPTYELPTKSSSLQKFLFRPATMPSGLSPNTVISDQYDCPTHMSLDEYKALCTIPLGYRIQWQNILLQLCAPSVDFKKVETTFVVLQSIYQAGPSSDEGILRSGHKIVDEESFAHAFLESLHIASQRVKENWESSQALSTFISLAARLLSLNTTDVIKNLCLGYLDEIRAIAFDWVNLLRDKAYRATLDHERTDLISKAVEIALVCVDSFNVDKTYLDQTLTSPNDASIFIQCSIFIQEGAYTISKSSDSMIHILHQRWKSLSYMTYPILAKEVLKARSRSLDDAIKKAWSAYQIGEPWQVVSEQFDYWLVTQMTTQGESDPLSVHFNLLTGELLVNGLPLARLPSKYEHHAAYRTLFGHSALEVMPTAVRGMQFSGKKKYAGYTLHFGINSFPSNPNTQDYDLLVQAVELGRKYELIPSWVFGGELPVAFAEDFVHWYDVTNDCVEFRPLKEPWTSSPNHWRLTRVNPLAQWRLMKDGTSLVSVKCKTARVISKILSPLEDPLRIHIVLQSSSSLEIELPRLQLGFHLNSGASSIQSRQFRGMSIDKSQSLDTLVGLHNKLILKHEENNSRLVIIPQGRVSYEEKGHHIRVVIDKTSAAKYHAYYIDDRIGRLIENGSLQSKLFLCYLHALTSHCLVDPLIQRTGTEQALSILESAGVRSFDRLTHENIDILHKIALLTPGRKCYPANERVMQTVEWIPKLRSLAQHGGFYKSVKIIFDQAIKTKIFYPDSYVQPPSLDHVDPELLERDCIRSSTFRVSGFGAEDHTVEHDTTYVARDREQNSARGFKAFVMSSIVFRELTTVHYRVSDLKAHLWSVLSRNPKILGLNHLAPIPELRYDARLLQDSCEIVSKYWSTLHQTFSQAHPRFDKFQLMIWLSTLAFAENSDGRIVQTLASFFTMPEMVQVRPPEITSFRLSQGAKIETSELRCAMRSALLPFYLCPEARLSRGRSERADAFNTRRQHLFSNNQENTLTALLRALKAQWPCEIPVTPIDDGFSTYMDMSKAMEKVRPMFKTWFHNYRFYNYLGQIENALRPKEVKEVEMPSYSYTTPLPAISRRSGFVCVDNIFEYFSPPVLPPRTENLTGLLSASPDADKTFPRLASLIDRIATRACSSYERNYAKGLQDSLLSLQCWGKKYSLEPKADDVEGILHNHLNLCKEHVEKIYTAISCAVTAGDTVENLLLEQRHKASAVATSIQQWPRLSPILLLQQLARNRWQKITNDWKLCLVHYALALVEFQRAERLMSLSNHTADLITELRNPGHTNWDPTQHPESLLLEVESGIMIREVQEQIAREMRGPKSAGNAVMQLNMGEGKSSVIVPMVAAALADSSRLVRVIVAKPQSRQMFQMLVSKLGGLLSRRVYHLPFSRSLMLGEAEINTIYSICQECMTNGGVLLVHPEHILSFQLMGLECLITGKKRIGLSLLSLQTYFDKSTRDIVDESDENFSVKFELIYTMGMQHPIELGPERWVCIQKVLELVRQIAPRAAKDFPLSVEVNERWPGGFPRTRFLGSDAQELIFRHIAKSLCETGFNGFPIARQTEAVREAVFKYITEPNLTSDEIGRVETNDSGGFLTETTRKPLLLLRGLIAGGVLAFSFSQKRWRVNYGLDANRQPMTKLAVPYRAKDNPTPRSEFSHPDVIIVLTSLSYYYGGIDDDDLFLAFSHLLKSDQADIEFQAWVKDAPSLPPAFRQLVGISLKDRSQCIKQVFPPLRYAKSVIDYFLGHIVFPKEMKEFPHKLSASGWDIGRIKSHPTTGFSGTNDARQVLPLFVRQLDLPEQNHTNALVLEHLLQPENSIALMPPSGGTIDSEAELLLDMVKTMNPPPQVILDVGAQIIELSNLGVAIQWLKRMPDHEKVQAVVFFDNKDELTVLNRKGQIEPLQTSSFAKQLDVCLVFLDEAHTRGTDLRLPEYYKAAVTLGPNLTKDRLVQACMRMRKLGKGQSVVFCVPEEIKTKILRLAIKPDDAPIEVSDILCWAVSETCIDMRRSIPLWAIQGQRFEHQSTLWVDYRTNNKIKMSKEQAKKFLEDESQSLKDRYRPNNSIDVISSLQNSQNTNLQLIFERCREFGSLEANSAKLQEEQERELSPEIEQERQVQRPAPAESAKHGIHPDLITFVNTGSLISNSKAHQPAFQTLRSTSGAAHLDVSQFPQDLLVTTDFARTILISGKSYTSDAYQRPVQWVLTSTGSSDLSNNTVKHAIIISPYEAQELLLIIRQSKIVTLHLYAPRSNLGFRSLDRLDLYTVPAQREARILPRRLLVLLNLFAGQLYLNSFTEYIELCELLGLAWEKAEGDCIIATDGFILRNGAGRGVSKSKSSFHDSPVTFLKVLMTKIRRDCEAIDKTHIGMILDGQLLLQSDFGESEC
ncbi:hypothetical protein M501DRAFT_432682 [Patellaria atrata CBS 101060]|uniref:ubiquitinyl hydrolase 1 n=1 Tax=Patellaria atrata CBS 101060 TaxID=1346257 RepID=A0A9P4S3G1_9PEZI|nr:hypothetical protein M501DRAFT_432682 [Patellaria atrata CBS 101060]